MIRTGHTFRFALPPSLGKDAMADRAIRLQRFFSTALHKDAEVAVSESYDSLAKEILSGRLEAAWAPPFVCARVEAMGVRVLVRGVRRGASTYRAVLLCRADKPLTPEQLSGKTALWTDKDSVGGYLLPMAFLKSRGLDPNKLFFTQRFAGSYKVALQGVVEGKADVTSLFAPPAASGADPLIGLGEVAPELRKDLAMIAATEEAPNDGVAVSMGAPAPLVEALEKTLLTMHESADGALLLKDLFGAERFEVAPRMGYRALYRVALATL